MEQERRARGSVTWQVQRTDAPGEDIEAERVSVLDSGVLLLLTGKQPVAIFADGTWTSVRLVEDDD